MRPQNWGRKTAPVLGPREHKRATEFAPSLPPRRPFLGFARPQNRGRKTAPKSGPHPCQNPQKRNTKKQRSNTNFGVYNTALCGESGAASIKNAAIMQSSFCLGKANVTVLSRQGTKENQQTKHKGMRRDVTTQPLRERSQRPMALLLPRASILPNSRFRDREEHENTTQWTTCHEARNLQILRQTWLPAHLLPSKDECCQDQGRRVA